MSTPVTTELSSDAGRTPPAEAGTPVEATVPLSPEAAAKAAKIQGLAQRSAARRVANEKAEAERAAEDPNAIVSGQGTWPDSNTPAGSEFTAEQWREAIDPTGANNVVMEMRTSQEGALVIFERLPEPTLSRVMRADGTSIDVPIKRTDEFLDAYLNPISSMMFDQCLVLGPKARTSHPGEVSGQVEVRGAPAPDWKYRVVRPASHRLDRPWLYGASGWLDFRAEAAVGRLVEIGQTARPGEAVIEATDTDDDLGDDTQLVRERQAG